MIQTLPVAIVLADDSVAIMRFVVQGRGGVLPEGAAWVAISRGLWARPAKPEYVEHEISRTFPTFKSWSFILDGAIPADRTFRDALTLVDGSLSHSMPKAQEVVLRNVRHERARKFEELDRQYSRHVGIDAVKAREIESERQRLRDLPQVLPAQMAGVKDVEGLKRFMVV